MINFLAGVATVVWILLLANASEYSASLTGFRGLYWGEILRLYVIPTVIWMLFMLWVVFRGYK